MPALLGPFPRKDLLEDLPSRIAACRDEVAELDMHDVTVRELFDALETGLAAALRLKLERRRVHVPLVLQ